jgi:hypothetical protein
MFWFLWAIIIAGSCYAFYDINLYSVKLADARDRINALQAKSEKLEKVASLEARKKREMEENLRLCRETEAEMKTEIALTISQFQTAQKQETELEMDMYKKEFKRSKQRKYE